VLAQDHSLFEWIIVDGGSTDSTVDFLQSLPPDTAQWCSERDAGIYDAMNKGIARSIGEYCIFMNAGDEFAADETLTNAASSLRGSADIVYGDAIEISNNGEAYKVSFRASRYWYSMFTHHQAIFYRRTAIFCGYDTSFRLAADWALTSHLIMSGAEARYIHRPICRFHRDGSSDSMNLRVIADRELWRIYTEVHRHRLPTAVVLYLLKRTANVIRFRAKPIYELIRMKAVSSEKYKS
jgi:putative colanic acid biosynthesis glycosyltransferase